MFPYTDSAKSEVDMFPRTDVLKWHSFCPLKPCGVRSLDVKSTEVNTEKGLKTRHLQAKVYWFVGCGTENLTPGLWW